MRWLLVCLMLVGCGDDAMLGGKKGGDGGGDEAETAEPTTPRSQYFATAAAMPACDAANQDWLVYVADEKKLKACLGGVWTDVETSPTTPPAAPAQTQGVDLIYSCSASNDLRPDDSDVLTAGLTMQATKFANGDWSVRCVDVNVNYAVADSISSTDQQFYKAGGGWEDTGVLPCSGFSTTNSFDTNGLVATWVSDIGGVSEQTACVEVQ